MATTVPFGALARAVAFDWVSWSQVPARLYRHTPALPNCPTSDGPVTVPPVDVFGSTDTELTPLLAVAGSERPSPLKSAAVTAAGLAPTA